MSAITECPQCKTRFKVSDDQLDAHDGLVRCGLCQHVFNARAQLQEEAPSPQLSLPIGDQPIIAEENDHFIAEISEEAVNQESIHAPPPEADLTVPDIDLTPVSNIPELETEPLTLAQQVEFIEEQNTATDSARPRKRLWLLSLLAILLLLALIAQSAYFFRTQLAAYLPGLKPLLSQYCALLDCDIELPRQVELMSIESSELESDRLQSNFVTLHALLHNNAPFTQAFPSLELTLTNLQDQAIARKIFHPDDYLKTGSDAPKGLFANRDLQISMRLDTTDLKPAGYRLFLFYPQ